MKKIWTNKTNEEIKTTTIMILRYENKKNVCSSSIYDKVIFSGLCAVYLPIFFYCFIAVPLQMWFPIYVMAIIEAFVIKSVLTGLLTMATAIITQKFFGKDPK